MATPPRVRMKSFTPRGAGPYIQYTLADTHGGNFASGELVLRTLMSVGLMKSISTMKKAVPNCQSDADCEASEPENPKDQNRAATGFTYHGHSVRHGAE